MRLGVFGGTFDPPHYAHLILAEQAHDQLGLDQVLWVPAGQPPHKPQGHYTPIDQRTEMVRLVIADNPVFELSLADVSRPGPHYTIDMLRLQAIRYPDARLFLLLGSDSLRDLARWHQPRLLITYAEIVVMDRQDISHDPAELERTIPGILSKTHFIDVPAVGISSELIRASIAAGRSVRYLVPAAVENYIREHGLYQTTSG